MKRLLVTVVLAFAPLMSQARVDFTIKASATERNAQAIVAKLPVGVTATVNGIPLLKKKSESGGHQYFANVKRAADYKLVLTDTRVIVIREQEFKPQFPVEMLVNSDLVIPYIGPRLAPQDRVSMRIRSVQPIFKGKKTATFTAILDANDIIVARTSFRNFKKGSASLYLAVSFDQSASSPPNRLHYVFASEHPIGVK